VGNETTNHTPARNNTHFPPPINRPQTSRGFPNPTPRAVEQPSRTTHSVSPSRRQIVIDTSDESGDGDGAPCLTTPITPSLSGTGGRTPRIPARGRPHLATPIVPSLSGTGRDVFSNSARRRPAGRDTSSDESHPIPTTPAVPSPSGTGGDVFHGSVRHHPAGPPVDTRTAVSEKSQHEAQHEVEKSLLRFRNPGGKCEREIQRPSGVGDGNGWYYVTVGRTVGVYNVW
jgi:hypothetical protein